MARSKKGVAFQTIIYAIITLVVVGVAGFVTNDILFGDSNLVKNLLGFGDISAFDKDIVDRFDATKELNSDAVSSVNGLLYATNRLAAMDTHNEPGEDKDFGNVKVKETVYDRRTIFPSGTKQNIVRTIVKNIISCEQIFRDKAYDNTRCFAIDSSKFSSNIVTSKDIQDDFEVYYQSDECDASCKEYIFDLAGYYGYNPFNWVFNTENWDWDKGLIIKKGTELVSICGDNTAVNEIHITTNTDTCKIDTNEKSVGFVVENFNLPQQVNTDSYVEKWLNAFGDPKYNLYYEKFPEGEEEYWKADSYNVAVGTTLTVEGFFFLIDVGTFAIGSKVLAPLKTALRVPMRRLLSATINPLLDVAKGGISKITPSFLRNTKSRLTRGLSGILGVFTNARTLLTDTISYPFRTLMAKQLTKEMAEESIEKTAKETVENALKRRLSKDTFAELGEETIEEMTEQYIKAWKNTKVIFDEVGDEMVDQASRHLTKNADDLLQSQMEQLFKEIDIDSVVAQSIKVWQDSGYDAATVKSLRRNLERNLNRQNALVRKLKTEIGEQGLEAVIFSLKNDAAQIAAEAALRTPTRAVIQKYKSAARASERLKIAITGDLTNEERQQVIEKIVKEGVNVLDNMDQRQVSQFLANTNTQDVVESVFRNKEIVWDLGGKKFTETQQQAAKEALDQALEGLPSIENFKFELQFKNAFSKTTQFLNPIENKRHIVAVAATIAALRVESMNAKFTSSGTNAFGFKIPFAAPVDYDELSHIKTKTQRGDFFENYGNPGYQGMLPEANRYWMSLTRDKNNWWWDQDPARMHLVSPCKADVYMRVSQCTCICKPIEDTVGTSETWLGALFENQGVYETGVPNSQLASDYPDKYIGGKINNFDGKNPTLFTLDENGNPIKQCNPSGEYFTFGEKEYKTECIKFDPVLDESLSQNYCYHGLSPAMGVANGYLNYALPTTLGIAAGAACSPTGVGVPLCGAVGSALGGVVGSLTYAIINTDHQWPNHR